MDISHTRDAEDYTDAENIRDVHNRDTGDIVHAELLGDVEDTRNIVDAEDTKDKGDIDLFQENKGGWIKVQNEKGKVKLRHCKSETSDSDNENKEWVVIDTDETRTDTLKLPKSIYYKVIRLFISDLLNCEKENNYFIFKKMPFVYTFFCGTVISCTNKIDKYYIDVDDGTSSIRCIIYMEDLNKQKSIPHNELLSCNKNNEDTLSEASAILQQCIHRIVKSVPSPHDLILGDTVKILGRLTEYKGNRYLFIKKLAKEPESTIYHCEQLEYLLDLYSEHYIHL